jgi:hypothetical protein
MSSMTKKAVIAKLPESVNKITYSMSRDNAQELIAESLKAGVHNATDSAYWTDQIIEIDNAKAKVPSRNTAELAWHIQAESRAFAARALIESGEFVAEEPKAAKVIDPDKEYTTRFKATATGADGQKVLLGTSKTLVAATELAEAHSDRLALFSITKIGSPEYRGMRADDAGHIVWDKVVRDTEGNEVVLKGVQQANQVSARPVRN